jgi:hypothetical protein
VAAPGSSGPTSFTRSAVVTTTGNGATPADIAVAPGAIGVASATFVPDPTSIVPYAIQVTFTSPMPYALYVVEIQLDGQTSAYEIGAGFVAPGTMTENGFVFRVSFGGFVDPSTYALNISLICISGP